jgi:hypothetical protein
VNDERAVADQSVMAGHGYYSANSRPQHVASAVAYPYLTAAAHAVPVSPTPLTIGDLGCAGGANEMEPMALVVETLRGRGVDAPIEVVHTDLPENDFEPLFTLLASPSSYTAGQPDVQRLHLAWSGITLHWLSSMPVTVPGQVYSNLTTGPARDALQRRAEEDWRSFLDERARELVDGGELVIVAGASQPDGRSGAEALFTLVGETLATMVADGRLRPHELDRIFYPTWNRTPDQWLAPFGGELGERLEILDSRLDASDDSQTFPQYSRDDDATSFAAAYTRFVRAVTEHPFFRSLDSDRAPADRTAVVEGFYERLEAQLASHPDVAAVWHVMSLRIRRRPRR